MMIKDPNPFISESRMGNSCERKPFYGRILWMNIMLHLWWKCKSPLLATGLLYWAASDLFRSHTNAFWMRTLGTQRYTIWNASKAIIAICASRCRVYGEQRQFSNKNSISSNHCDHFRDAQFTSVPRLFLFFYERERAGDLVLTLAFLEQPVLSIATCTCRNMSMNNQY